MFISSQNALYHLLAFVFLNIGTIRLAILGKYKKKKKKNTFQILSKRKSANITVVWYNGSAKHKKTTHKTV